MEKAEIIEQAMRAYDVALKALNERRAQVEQEIADLTKERDRMQRQKYRGTSSNGAHRRGGQGRARGESKKIIAMFLNRVESATQSAIADATEVPISTCGRVLNKFPKEFERQGNEWVYIGPPLNPNEEEGGIEEIDLNIDE